MITRFRLAVAAGLVAVLCMLATTDYVREALAQQGFWPGLPVVGGASGGGRPAGPSIVTGSELVPADTGLSQGLTPQTVLLSLGSLNAYPYQLFTEATTGNTTFIMSDRQGGLILSAASTIGSAVVQFPPNPIDGQQFFLSANQTVTAVLISPATNASGSVIPINNKPTVITASTTAPMGYRWIFNTVPQAWNRLQ